MRFLFAKHRGLICKQCNNTVEIGELYLRTFFKKDTFSRSFPYHYECYITFITEHIRQQALHWMGQLTRPPKQGRPVKSSNPPLYRKLKALQRWHKKASHPEEVEKLERRIKEIEYAPI